MIFTTDEGTIDLSKLALPASSAPRFKDVAVVQGLTVSWNPCNKWTKPSSPSSTYKDCEDIAVCGTIISDELDLGKQETAEFNFNTTAKRCVLSFTGKSYPETTQSPKTFISLQCDSTEEGRLESVGPPENVDDSAHLSFLLHSKYACPRKSGLSTGSVLIIIFGCVLLVYIVAGVLFNKFHRGASGKEVIPNVNFWMDFPLLVKDGVEFSYQFCKKTCGRKRSSYEEI